MHIGCTQCKKELGAFDLKPHKCEPKPEPKPDNVLYINAYYSTYEYFETGQWLEPNPKANLKLIFDSETGELKSAEVIK
jgi:hypothetical protein